MKYQHSAAPVAMQECQGGTGWTRDRQTGFEEYVKDELVYL